MNVLRTRGLALFCAALVAACSSPSPQEKLQNAELAALAPLKTTYSGVVMGFDFSGDTTLLVSIDIQNYMGTDDDKLDAMKRDLLKSWRTAWTANHPGARGVLTVRLIDFVGKPIFEEKTTV